MINIRVKYIGKEGEVSTIVGLFKRNEIKDLPKDRANRLLINANFIKVREYKPKEEKVYVPKITKVEVINQKEVE